MRIAQVAPLMEPVPPELYGGTERVVHGLTEELVRRGHQVTLFASADSVTAAQLIPCSRRGLRADHESRNSVSLTLIQLGKVAERAGRFDLIHNHVDYFAFPLVRALPNPILSTTHGRLDMPEIKRVYESFPDADLCSISYAQRSELPHARWLGTVYNGIDPSRFRLRERPGDYLAFLGRISPEKRVDRAIEIARAVGMRLLIAAKVDPADEQYFEHAIKPLLRHPLVEYVGEIDERQKDDFIGKAYAYLFPIDWPEPFGITMIESMATGTPVIASRCGSVPEVVVDGRTGFICDDIRQMVEAVERIPAIRRAECRQHVIDHFTVTAMVDGYEAIYRQMLKGRERAAGAL